MSIKSGRYKDRWVGGVVVTVLFAVVAWIIYIAASFQSKGCENLSYCTPEMVTHPSEILLILIRTFSMAGIASGTVMIITAIATLAKSINETATELPAIRLLILILSNAACIFASVMALISAGSL